MEALLLKYGYALRFLGVEISEGWLAERRLSEMGFFARGAKALTGVHGMGGLRRLVLGR
jgi:hypothetical protein